MTVLVAIVGAGCAAVIVILAIGLWRVRRALRNLYRKGLG